MVKIDARLLAAGAAMIGVGIALSMYIEYSTPVGMSGMTDGEIAELLLDQRIGTDMGNLVAILLGVGFLLILLSLGTKIPRRNSKKSDVKKP